MPTVNFDRLARTYRWLEYLSFGPSLERCRDYRLQQLKNAKRALILGDGDGRFLSRLLKENRELVADVVDLSPAMLRLLAQRAATINANDRVALHHVDARSFVPTAAYDLIVTHFFLDCFNTEELAALVGKIRPHLAPGAIWIVSEFAIPANLASWPAQIIVNGLYLAFGVLAGLPVRRLPDYASVLTSCGLSLRAKHSWLSGLLVSELWA